MKHSLSISDNVSTFTYRTDYFDRIFEKICISLKLLNMEYKCSLKPEVNPTKIPCYIRYSYTIVVNRKDEDVLKELFILTAPKIQYSISQREGKVRAKLNV